MLKRFEKDCLRQIDQLSGMILEQLSDTKRTTLNSLIINRVHCRDVIQNMTDHGVEHSTNFLQKVQMKLMLYVHNNYHKKSIVK